MLNFDAKMAQLKTPFRRPILLPFFVPRFTIGNFAKSYPRLFPQQAEVAGSARKSFAYTPWVRTSDALRLCA
jgi:hypothetical protein